MKPRNPLTLVPLFAAATAVAYIALVKPSMERLSRNRTALANLRQDAERRQLDIRLKSEVQRHVAEQEAELKRLGALQLEPLLESYAMRAKAIVGAFAEQAGLVDVEFSERTPLALPVPTGSAVPSALHARRLVQLSCQGDYAAIVSFILRVEHELPHVALGALRIMPGGRDANLQSAEIVLEWPAKGAERK